MIKRGAKIPFLEGDKMLDHVEILYNGNKNYIIDRNMWYDSPDLGRYEEWLVNQIVDFITFNSDCDSNIKIKFS